MKLSPAAILRQSSKLSGANLAGAVLSLGENIVVARVLAPALLGNIGFLMLWSQYASFVRPGFWSAAYREIPTLLGQRRTEDAITIQNAGLTADWVWLVVPVSVMLVASAFFDDPLLRVGLWLTAAAFVATTLFSSVTEVHWLHQRFGLITRIRVASRLLTPAIGVALVFAFGVYGVLWKLLLVPLLLAVAVARYGPSIGFRWTWNRALLVKLLQVGIPLSLISLFAAGFRIVDRTVVSAWLSREDLGYLTFALLYINLTISFITDFGSVLQPVFWTELGRAGDVRRVRQTVERLALLILVAATAAATLLQAAFPAFVYWFTPRYEAAIPTFEVLAFTTATLTATIMPSLVLESSVVGRQGAAAAAWAISVAVNVGLAIAAVRAGYGLVGVAWATVFAQCFIVVLLYGFVHRHLYQSVRESLPFYASALACLAAGGAVYAVFQHPQFAGAVSAGEWTALTGRLTAALGVWSALAVALYGMWRRPSLSTAQIVEQMPSTSIDNR